MMEKAIQFYEWINRPVMMSPRNLELVGYNLQSLWLGQKVSQDLQLHLNHPKDTYVDKFKAEGYYRVTGFFLDSDQTRPYPKAIIWLQGDIVSALMELNLSEKPIIIQAVRFSPVPIGLNGCPSLVQFGQIRATLILLVAGIMLGPSTPGVTWSVEEIVKTLRDMPSILSNTLQHTDPMNYIDDLVKLAIIEEIKPGFTKEKRYHSLMTVSQFEAIFGVKLVNFKP